MWASSRHHPPSPHPHRPIREVVILRGLELQTTRMLSQVPRWDHIVSNKNYNSGMVQKQLLNHAARGSLPDAISTLATMKEATCELFRDLAPSGTAASEVDAAEDALEVSNLAMIVLAGCHVAEEFATTPQGKGMATQLLSKLPMGFPDCLKRRLQKISQTD